jgi:hypothetical protein
MLKGLNGLPFLMELAYTCYGPIETELDLIVIYNKKDEKYKNNIKWS